MFIIVNDETDKLNLPAHSNHDTMYINSFAVYVHSAIDVLPIRGNMQLYIQGGGGIAPGVKGFIVYTYM